MTVADWLVGEVGRAVDDWTARWRRGETGPWYLWYARGSLLIVAEGVEPPSEHRLGSGDRVPGDRERAAVVAWVLERARRLPCLPAEPAAG